MARVRQTARKRAVGAGKSRAKAAAANAGAEAESETESESESWLDKVDGFGQADAPDAFRRACKELTLQLTRV